MLRLPLGRCSAAAHGAGIQDNDRMEDAHTNSVDEVLSFFSTDSETGLSEEQVQQAQEKYGPNGKQCEQYYMA